MKKSILLSAILFSTYSLAKVPQAQVPKAPEAVYKAAERLKHYDVRTVIKPTYNIELNPCLPKGKSWDIQLQVKRPSINYQGKIEFVWDTVKTVNASSAGKIVEVCEE